MDPPAASQAPAHLLVVDDQEIVRTYHRCLLERDGYRVQTAASAEEALHLLERHTFDLILLDLKMPGMDGMAFLRRLRQQGDTSEVLMVSAFATTEDAVEATRLGVANVLPKPCSPVKLLAQVRHILDLHRNAVVEYIRAHFAETGSREELAHQFHCHPDTLSDQVEQQTGQPFHTFLESLRIQEARRLLTETDLKAKEIAPRVGFRDYSTFRRAFRRQTGRSPSQYRRENRSLQGP